MADLIDPNNLDNFLRKVPEWEVDGDIITRTFEFDEFQEAIDFVNSVAEIAEEAQHYPDIEIHFNAVALSLTTHDLGGLTKSDFEVAGRIDNLVD